MSEMKRSLIGMIAVIVIMLVVAYGLDPIVTVYDYIFKEHSVWAILGTFFVVTVSLFAFVEDWD